MYIYNGKLNWFHYAINECITVVVPGGFALNDPIGVFWQWSMDESGGRKSNACQEGIINSVTKTSNSEYRISFSFDYYSFDGTVSRDFRTLTAIMRNRRGESDPNGPTTLQLQPLDPVATPSMVVYTGKLNWYEYAEGEMVTLVVSAGVTDGAPVGLYYEWTINSAGNRKQNYTVNSTFCNVGTNQDGEISGIIDAGYYTFNVIVKDPKQECWLGMTNPDGDRDPNAPYYLKQTNLRFTGTEKVMPSTLRPISPSTLASLDHPSRMQHVDIARSPSPDVFSETNPLRDVRPEILSNLAHLDVSGRIRSKSAKVVSLGSYGDVMKGSYATSDNAKLTVAIKRLRIFSEEITSRFEKEIYVWSKLRHPNILALVGYAFEPSGFPVFISEWMENGSVSSYVKKNPLCDILYLVHGIAEGLGYLHNKEDVIHSDIKPENVLVSRYGNAVICDFGVSRMAVASRTLGQLTSTPKGTSRYMAYELLTSDSKNSKESDVWAFGMTVFELLAHQLPYAEYQRDVQVILAITKGKLPILPETRDVKSWPEKRLLWDICQSCWVLDPSTRTTMTTIVTKVDEALILRPSSLHSDGPPDGH